MADDDVPRIKLSQGRATHICPRCGTTTEAGWCCGIDLSAARPWQMTADRVRMIHLLARSQKGLTEEEYRLRLGAMGVDSSKQLSRSQFHFFVQRLRALHDAPRWLEKRGGLRRAG